MRSQLIEGTERFDQVVSVQLGRLITIHVFCIPQANAVSLQVRNILTLILESVSPREDLP